MSRRSTTSLYGKVSVVFNPFSFFSFSSSLSVFLSQRYYRLKLIHPPATGNSTIIDELYHQLNGIPPTAIVCSVGGGGLLNGLILGLDRYGWYDSVSVIGMETHGADSLSASIAAGELVTLPAITSIARSLGVTRVSEKTWEFAQRGNVHNVVLSDAQAAMACVRLADEERIVVEPACGVSVAACYGQTLREVVPDFSEESRVVIIVCGGEFNFIS
jgi:L-serine/L-threonine ammonia-lyase